MKYQKNIQVSQSPRWRRHVSRFVQLTEQNTKIFSIWSLKTKKSRNSPIWEAGIREFLALLFEKPTWIFIRIVADCFSCWFHLWLDVRIGVLLCFLSLCVFPVSYSATILAVIICHKISAHSEHLCPDKAEYCGLFQGLGRCISTIYSAAKCHYDPTPIKTNWTPCEPLALYCPPSMTLVRPEERNIALIHSAHTHAHTEKPNVVTQAGNHCYRYKMWDIEQITIF